MIAAIEGQDSFLHIVKWTGRVRLHVGVVTYCGQEHDAAAGVLQVPDTVFSQSLGFVVRANVKGPPCPRCRVAAQAAVS